MQRPIFSAMETEDQFEFYVCIRWADGAERRVSRFAQRQTAERWIEAEAENWLGQRLGQPDLPLVEKRSPSIMSANPEVEDRARDALALAA
jgi:hypothetical protein